MSLAEFLEGVVEATAEYAACFKPNVAFFERLGLPGLTTLAGLIESIRRRENPVLYWIIVLLWFTLSVYMILGPYLGWPM